jgi:hypothetical protein
VGVSPLADVTTFTLAGAHTFVPATTFPPVLFHGPRVDHVSMDNGQRFVLAHFRSATGHPYLWVHAGKYQRWYVLQPPTTE